jgi:hypothetical protein
MHYSVPQKTLYATPVHYTGVDDVAKKHHFWPLGMAVKKVTL